MLSPVFLLQYVIVKITSLINENVIHIMGIILVYIMNRLSCVIFFLCFPGITEVAMEPLMSVLPAMRL